MLKNKINVILLIVGVLTIGVFLKNVLGSNCFISNKTEVFAESNREVGNQAEIQKVNIAKENLSKDISVGYMEGDTQIISFDLLSYSYPNLQVKVGTPVKLIINVDSDNLNSCNYVIVSPDFGFKKQLEVGENIIEFTPTEVGEYVYSCWMGMLGAYIDVVEEDITPNLVYGDNISLGNCCSRP